MTPAFIMLCTLVALIPSTYADNYRIGECFTFSYCMSFDFESVFGTEDLKTMKHSVSSCYLHLSFTQLKSTAMKELGPYSEKVHYIYCVSYYQSVLFALKNAIKIIT